MDPRASKLGQVPSAPPGSRRQSPQNTDARYNHRTGQQDRLSIQPSVKSLSCPPGDAMTIVVNDKVHLSEVRPSDKEALIQHLNDRDIYERTLRIPFPYTGASADEWLALLAETTQQQGRAVHWAIRQSDGALIGGCGFDGFQVGESHRAEIGYWLA